MKTSSYYEYISFASLSIVVVFTILLFVAGLFAAGITMTVIAFVVGPLFLFGIDKMTQWAIEKRAAR